MNEVIPSTARQWQLSSIQLVNWGGFDGYHNIDFMLATESGPGATLITGRSGVGKSTIMDAYIAVMMPNNTRFNSASNKVGRGKARGDQERTVLTYLQGKTDDIFDSTSNADRSQLLRDESCARWSAIVVTFVDNYGALFSAAKYYYLKSGCVNNDGYKVFMVTAQDALDPRKLEAIANEPFDKRRIRGLYEKAQVHDSVGAYQQKLYSSLNIGAHGDGANAIELLARIQAGYQITTVDDLFKELVLEKPKTFEKADAAIAHFDDIEKSYEEIEVAKSKMVILANIPDDKAKLDEAHSKSNQITLIGEPSVPDSPFNLWLTRYKQDMLVGVLEKADAQISELERSISDYSKQLDDRSAELEEAEAESRRNGADALKQLEIEIAEKEATAERRRQSRAVFESKLSLVGTTPENENEYEVLRKTAELFVAGYEVDKDRLTEKRDELVVEKNRLQSEINELKEARDYYRSHTGNIPPYLNKARETISHATGIPVTNLPFVGELIDLKAEEEQWRLAAETTLHGLARTILVEKGQLEHLSKRIDAVTLNTRVTFQGVKTNADYRCQMHPRGIASKLQFDKDSPFSPWVRKRVADPKIDAVCVESPAQLQGDELRVTINGQTRMRSRGAHGRNPKDTNVIGFDNRKKLEAIRTEIAELSSRFYELENKKRDEEDKLKKLEKLKEVYSYVLDKRFEDIDYAGMQEQVERLKEKRDQILHANDRLRILRERIVELDNECEQLREIRSSARARLKALAEKADGWQAQKEHCIHLLQEFALKQVSIAEPQALLLEEIAYELEENYASHRTILAGFSRFTEQLANELDKQRRTAESNISLARNALERTFRAYKNQWSDNDLGTSIESYDDYFEILEDVREQGLYDRTDEWLESMQQWVAEDLVPVANAYNNAIREIEERLEPINEILQNFEFGAARGHLRIDIRRKVSETANRFKQELDTYAALATAADIDDIERHHKKVKAFMRRLKEGRDGTGERDELLDRRRQVELSAHAIWPESAHKADSVYRQLGEKSGGEVQELVAFILGSALMFCLDNETLERPGFTTVMLDEGFVKADEEFTQRAVQAWQGFGFQIIIAVPDGKVGSLVGQVGQYLTVTKDSRGYAYVATATLSEEDHAEKPA